MEKKVP